MIALRFLEQSGLGGFLVYYYLNNSKDTRLIVTAVICLCFAANDLLAGLIFGYWTKNPVGLFLLYIVQWLAIASYLSLGCVLVKDYLIIAIIVWVQTLIFYVLFHYKLHR